MSGGTGIPGGVAPGGGEHPSPAAASTLQSEVGTNGFRISDMGPDGDTAFTAEDAAVAYNATDNEYLVVWDGDDDTGSLVDEEFEIFGQRLVPTFLDFFIGDSVRRVGPLRQWSFTLPAP